MNNFSNFSTKKIVLVHALPGTIVLLMISLLGFFGNANIVVATVRSKKLSSKCNYLISILAVADFVTQIGHLFYAYFLFTGTLTRSQGDCYFFMAASTTAMNFATVLIWTIGVDRLLSVKIPQWYIGWPHGAYCMIMLCPSIVYSAAMQIIGWNNISPDKTFCILPEAYGHRVKHIWFGSQLTINLLVIVTYSYLAWLVKRKSVTSIFSERTNEKTKRIFKAVMTIMAFYIFGWLLTIVVVEIALLLGVSVTDMFYVELYAGWFANISVSCNYYVYYYISSDYQTVFRQQIFWRQPPPSSSSINMNELTPLHAK